MSEKTREEMIEDIATHAANKANYLFDKDYKTWIRNLFANQTDKEVKDTWKKIQSS